MQLARGDLAQQLLVALTVTLVGGQRDLQTVAGGLALHGLLQPGDQVAHAVEVDERLAPLGGVEHLALVVLEGVLDADHAALFYLHGGRG